MGRKSYRKPQHLKPLLLRYLPKQLKELPPTIKKEHHKAAPDPAPHTCAHICTHTHTHTHNHHHHHHRHYNQSIQNKNYTPSNAKIYTLNQKIQNMNLVKYLVSTSRITCKKPVTITGASAQSKQKIKYINCLEDTFL